MKVLVISEQASLLEKINQLSVPLAGLQLSTIQSNLLNTSQKLASELPDVVIVDVSVNDQHIFEITERFKALHKNMSFVMLTHDSSSDLLIKAIRTGFSEVIVLPVTETALLQALERLQSKKTLSANVQSKVISLIASKGGSGATFVTTNLAYALSEHCHKRVLLIDANPYFGDASMYVSDEEPKINLSSICEQINRLDTALLESSLISVTAKFKLLAANNDPGKVFNIQPDHLDLIIKLARNLFDYVLIDTGRQVDAITVKVLDNCDLILPVVQLSLPSIRDTRSLMQTFRSLGYASDKIKLLINRFESKNKLNNGDLIKAIQVEPFAKIPNDYLNALDSVNQGVSICKLSPKSAISQEIIRLAKVLDNSQPSKKSGFFKKLFK